MRRLTAVLLAFLLLSAGAACAGPSGGPDTEPRGAILTILNTDRFDGMGQTYNEGYLPQVEEGTVRVILPLAARQKLDGGVLTVRVQAPDSAPFVLPTYDRTVLEELHPATGEDGEEMEISCFLVSFDLPLAQDAQPGRWPLVIAASGQTEEGTEFTESFTVYVTVPEQERPQEVPPSEDPGSPGTDGTVFAGETSSGGGSGPAQSTPPPVPRLMLASFQTSMWPVKAGEDFQIEAVLRNVSPTQAVTNVMVTLLPQGEALAPQPGQPLSFHFDGVPAGDAVSFTAFLHAEGSAGPGTQRIAVQMAYEGKDNQQYTGEDEILLTLSQPVRLAWDVPEIPETVRAGDTLNLAFQVMNLGRAPLYNVRITLEGQGLQPETSLFLGNLGSGEAGQGDMYVFVGMLDPDDPERKYGSTSGNMILVAENAEGETTTLSEAFGTQIEAPVINVPETLEKDVPEDDTSVQWIVTALVAAGIVAVLLAVQITKKRMMRRSA